MQQQRVARLDYKMYLKLIELFGNSEKFVPFWNLLRQRTRFEDIYKVELLHTLQQLNGKPT